MSISTVFFLAIGSSTAIQLKLLIVKPLRDSLLSSYCKYYSSWDNGAGYHLPDDSFTVFIKEELLKMFIHPSRMCWLSVNFIGWTHLIKPPLYLQVERNLVFIKFLYEQHCRITAFSPFSFSWFWGNSKYFVLKSKLTALC